MKLLEASTNKLKDLLDLSYGTLYIPYSQRPYEWQYEQVLRLFNDFYSIYTHNDTDATHILNFITIRLDDDDKHKKYIYDGQQRTVTSLLILSALIDELKNIDPVDTNAVNQLTSSYLYTANWRDGSDTNYKIEFDSDVSNGMLHETIFRGKNINESHVFSDYDKALFENYKYIKDLIKEKFGNTPSREKIKNFINDILERILVIIIETSYENIAEEMFETLNSTGLNVEDFYILKNSLIRTLDESIVKPIWSSIDINTDRINKNNFLHAYVSVINGKTPKTNLYNRISSLKDLDSPKIAKSFLQELQKTAELFMKIENPSYRTDGTQEENSKYNNHILNLKLLNAVQYKTVILAMGLRDFNIHDINLTLEKIISLQLRNIFIAKDKANTVEVFFPSLAEEIYSRKISSLSDILSKISDMMVNDSQLYEFFNNREIDSNKDEAIIRFILKEIYNSEHSEIIVDSNSIKVNLEHILPKSPDKDSQWLDDFPDEEERYTLTRKIGNMTVLSNSINSKVNNRDFSIKKISYSKSHIPSNQNLAGKSEWKKPDIDQRTIDLYSIFKNIWSK